MSTLGQQIGRRCTQEEGKLRKCYAGKGDDGEGKLEAIKDRFLMSHKPPVRCMQTWQTGRPASSCLTVW